MVQLNTVSYLSYFNINKIVEIPSELTVCDYQKISGESHYRAGCTVCPEAFFVEFLKKL